MNRLIIGTVTALLTPDECESTLDDRQELIKVISYLGGAFVPSVVVVDGGSVPNGQVDKYGGVKLSAADFQTVYTYWSSRTLVTVTGLDGVAHNNCRVILRNPKPQKNFTSVICDIEIWRV